MIVNPLEKVPIETLPVELRIKIYELGDVETISTDHVGPWGRTILLSGILNDKDAIKIGGHTQENHVQLHCILRESAHDELGSVR
jgi:hypothetical protein